MSTDTLNALAKYVIALAVVLGCFAIIYQSAPTADNTQPWSVITLIAGWLIRDSAGNTATANVARIAQATAQAPKA